MACGSKYSKNLWKMFEELGVGVSCESSEVSENNSEVKDDEEELDEVLDLVLSETLVLRFFFALFAPEEKTSFECKSVSRSSCCLVSLL